MSFFIAAYAFLWIGIFGYLLWLAARMRALREEVRALAGDDRAGERSSPSSRHLLEPPLRR